MVAFSLLLGLFGAASVWALLGLHEMHEAMHAVEEDAGRMRVALRLASAVRDQYAHIAHTIILGDDSHLDLYEEALTSVRSAAAEVSNGPPDGARLALVQEILLRSGRLDEIFRKELLPAISLGARDIPSDVHPRILDEVFEAQALADRLAVASERTIAEFGKHAAFVQHAAIQALIVFLAVAAICGVGVAVYLHRRVAVPVASLAAGTARIAGGDLDTRLEVTSQDELGRLARDFNAMTLALKEHQQRLVHSETLAGIGRMAAGVAHELNNPVTVILGYVKMLRRRASSEMDAELAIVEKEGERCQEIVEELVDITRRSPISQEVIDLRALCEEALERFRHASPSARVETRIEGDYRVVGARNKLAQVVYNLIKNAREAAGPEGRVELDISPTDPERVALTVADSGPGVAPEVRPRLFEPFFTTKPSGTGLGLAVSRAVARLHGGDLELVEGGSGGARFRLTLPTVPREAAR